ncbi:MAG: uncharacterized protein KVP18_001485 [Porospora cf. gigantea A]|uniref:uncharacterized protein n=1 Tax=Porospora cf. gigantea A TaxID=2853593 RepID=UPI00355A7D29|nr:MAG: hypothetical protein KVP18_001485 [Porospora cf. gigantea A]
MALVSLPTVCFTRKEPLVAPTLRWIRLMQEVRSQGVHYADDCMELKVARYLSRVERAAMCKTRTVEYPQKPPRSDGNLYVKNLAHDVDDSSLRELFSSCGTVVNARVVREPTGGSRGFGFVSLSSHEEATRAIAEFNSKVVKGKAIFVNYAENKKRVQRVPYGVPPPVYYRNPVWGQYPAFPSYGELPYPQAGPFYPPTQYDSGVDMAELNQELNDAPAASHKQLIGERLYPVVQRYDPQFAGKITGMMLEMSKPELMNIMQSEQSISLKVGEAKAVLQRAQTARRR